MVYRICLAMIVAGCLALSCKGELKVPRTTLKKPDAAAEFARVFSACDTLEQCDLKCIDYGGIPLGSANERLCGYVEDEKHGPYASWHTGGGNNVRGVYVHGVKDGMWREWDSRGRLVSEVVYAMGKATTKAVGTPENSVPPPMTEAVQAKQPAPKRRPFSIHWSQSNASKLKTQVEAHVVVDPEISREELSSLLSELYEKALENELPSVSVKGKPNAVYISVFTSEEAANLRTEPIGEVAKHVSESAPHIFNNLGSGSFKECIVSRMTKVSLSVDEQKRAITLHQDLRDPVHIAMNDYDCQSVATAASVMVAAVFKHCPSTALLRYRMRGKAGPLLTFDMRRPDYERYLRHIKKREDAERNVTATARTQDAWEQRMFDLNISYDREFLSKKVLGDDAFVHPKVIADFVPRARDE